MKIAFKVPDNVPSTIQHGGLENLSSILRALIIVLILGGVLFAVWEILMSAIKIIFSRGEKERYQKAQNKLKFAIIGLVAIFFSFVIISFFSSLVGHSLI